MPSYKIERWDSVLTGNNDFPYPMIYIKPDQDFLNYIKENNYMFLTQINGTNSQYDNNQVIGMADVSGFFPNYRPNFFNETGYYVIVIFTNWLGYPPDNGTIEIKGTKGPDNVGNPPPRAFQVPKPIEWYSDDHKNKLSENQIKLLLGTIFSIFVILFLVSFKK